MAIRSVPWWNGPCKGRRGIRHENRRYRRGGIYRVGLVRYLIGHTGHEVLVVDKLTYAGNLASLASVEGNSRHRFSKTDICDRAALGAIFSDFNPDAVMDLAAESHVDRSIDGPADFVNTNIVGTYELLEAAFSYWSKLDRTVRNDSASITYRRMKSLAR